MADTIPSVGTMTWVETIYLRERTKRMRNLESCKMSHNSVTRILILMQEAIIMELRFANYLSKPSNYINLV